MKHAEYATYMYIHRFPHICDWHFLETRIGVIRKKEKNVNSIT